MTLVQVGDAGQATPRRAAARILLGRPEPGDDARVARALINLLKGAE